MQPILRSVDILLHNAAGEIFLQMRCGSAKTHPLCWSFWGGAVDASDQGNAIAAALRELREELHFDAPADAMKIISERRSSTQIAPLVRCTLPVSWTNITVSEGAGAGFFTLDDLKTLSATPAIAHYIDSDASLLLPK